MIVNNIQNRSPEIFPAICPTYLTNLTVLSTSSFINSVLVLQLNGSQSLSLCHPRGEHPHADGRQRPTRHPTPPCSLSWPRPVWSLSPLTWRSPTGRREESPPEKRRWQRLPPSSPIRQPTGPTATGQCFFLVFQTLNMVLRGCRRWKADEMFDKVTFSFNFFTRSQLPPPFFKII